MSAELTSEQCEVIRAVCVRVCLIETREMNKKREEGGVHLCMLVYLSACQEVMCACACVCQWERD